MTTETAPKTEAPAKKAAAKKAPAKAAAKAPAKKAPAKKAEKSGAEYKPVAGLKPEQKLKYGKDADGKLYAPGNTPHRDGSTSQTKWKAMKIPATINDILAGGMGRGYLQFYIENEILVPA